MFPDERVRQWVLSVPRALRYRSGAVTFIQRFSDALNLDPHFHVLALDGIYVEEGDGPPDPPATRRPGHARPGTAVFLTRLGSQCRCVKNPY